MSPRPGKGGLAFLDDRAAFVRRFVLAEVLAPPRGMTVHRAPARRVERASVAAAPTPPPPPAAKPR